MTADEIRKNVAESCADAAQGEQTTCDRGTIGMLMLVGEIAAQLAESQVSLRDRFAMSAMQGMLSACNGPAWGNDMFPLAESAYAYADAMLKERAK